MADFTSLGPLCQEWKDYESESVNPIANLGDAAADPLAFRNAANSYIDTTKAEELKSYTNIHRRDVTIPTRDKNTIQLRIHTSAPAPSSGKLPLLVHYHGGGFLVGDINSDDMLAARVINALSGQLIVISVNYRHTPEWTYPTAVHDAWDGFDWVWEHVEELGADKEKVFVGGISAGGSLAAAVSLREKDEGKSRIKAQLLTVPLLCEHSVFPDHLISPMAQSSLVQNKDAPILKASIMKTSMDLLKVKDPKDRYISPLLVANEELGDGEWGPGKGNGSKEGWVDTWITVAGTDPLRDEAMLYEGILRSAGVRTALKVFPGLPHGFGYFESLPSRKLWDQAIVDAVKWMLEA